MSQKRINNYGDFINSPDSNAARYATTPKGVYRGFELGVDSAFNLTIAPGSGCQHNGIVWQEDAELTLVFTATAAPKIETVVAIHDNQPTIIGGAAVTYELRSGAITDAALSNGVVVGWIYYPGGSVNLDVSHLVEAPSRLSDEAAALAVDTAPVKLLPSFHAYSDIAGMGANVVFDGETKANLLATPRMLPPQLDGANFVVYQDVTKTGGPVVFESLVQHFPFFATAYRPVSFDFYLDMTATATIDVELRDTDLNIVTISGSPITGTGAGWVSASVVVDRTSGNFDVGKPYELRLTHNVNVAHSIKLARIVAQFYPYPS